MAKFKEGDIVEVGRPGGDWGLVKALVSDDGVIPRYEIEIDDKVSIYPEYMLTYVGPRAEPKLTIPEVPSFCFPMTVDILGTKYGVVLVDKFDDDESNFIGGFTDPDLHLIKIRDLEKIDAWKKGSAEKIEARQKEILRHEIVHAYLDESGLKWCTLDTGDSWARNEEMVDWFAIQGPKIMETWQKAGCI